ncbi:MAG: phosphoribosylamine--glycine ligase, partial [Pirellulales bacterium]|nr:phosphoribosylamine--glycine ligase [Pirellulales bacterium]
MNVMVIGGGGREHSLAWKLRQSPLAERVFVAPGNAGTAVDAENVPIDDDDIPAQVKFARENRIGLAVVGPETPLAAGVVDAFIAAGILAFGPSKQAAELEASKVFCKNLLRAADVPTADYRTFADAASAERYLQTRDDLPVVVKADGLAAGKGVIVCNNTKESLEAVRRIAADREFGAAGRQLVIEERLIGQEASVLALTDGRTIVTLPAAQDHKPAYDGDRGPNTGGMGAFSPTPLITDELLRTIEERVLVPTVHQMK